MEAGARLEGSGPVGAAVQGSAMKKVPTVGIRIANASSVVEYEYDRSGRLVKVIQAVEGRMCHGTGGVGMGMGCGEESGRWETVGVARLAGGATIANASVRVAGRGFP